MNSQYSKFQGSKTIFTQLHLKGVKQIWKAICWQRVITIYISDGSCVFPSIEWDGAWLDSRTGGTIQMTSATTQVTSGWILTAYSSRVTSWTCEKSDANNNLLLFT